MPAAPTARQLLLVFSTASFPVVFLAFILYEQPGLGLAHFFYLSIALTAMATGPQIGALAGLAGTALYVRNPGEQGHPVDRRPHRQHRHPVRHVRQHRRADRDVREPQPRDVERAAHPRGARRAHRPAQHPRVRSGDHEAPRDGAAVRPAARRHGRAEGAELGGQPLGGQRGSAPGANRLSRSLAAEDQIARVGSDEFAVLASTATLDEASELSVRLEWVLSSQGTKATFGWAIHPQEGENALALLSRRERAALRAQGDARLPPHGACSREAPRGL